MEKRWKKAVKSELLAGNRAGGVDSLQEKEEASTARCSEAARQLLSGSFSGGNKQVTLEKRSGSAVGMNGVVAAEFRGLVFSQFKGDKQMKQLML
ncbi:hypothetical protein AOLI_G00191220 [Acnodon oligacanthus]